MRCKAVIAILAILLLAICICPSHAWKFVSMADSRGDNNGVNTTVLSGLINLINAENADLVLFQGDAVTGCADTCLSSQMDTWLSTINALNCPWYYTVGNHEVYGSNSENVVRTKIDQPLNGPSGHEELVFSFDHKDMHVTSLNSNHYGEYHHVQRSWLTTDLANSSQPHLFVMAHEPAYPKGSHIGSSLDTYASERNDLWNILTNAGVRMYFCGHEHFYARSLEGSIYQVINGTCGAPINTGYSGTIAQYHYLLVDVNGYNVSCTAKNDSGQVIDSWSYTLTSSTPIVTSPDTGNTVNTTTPTIQWDSPTHDQYQVRVTRVNDPGTVIDGWDSGEVTSSADSAVCGNLNDYSLYYVFVRVHTASGWSGWSPKNFSFAVNTDTSVATIYSGDSLPTLCGWQVFDTTSYENGNGIKSTCIPDGESEAWKLFDNHTTNRCKESYSVSNISFDTGATVAARIKAVGISGASTNNLGISNGGVGGMYLNIQASQIELVDANGVVRGTYTVNGTVYHKYCITVKNAIYGDNNSATWRVYVDGTERIGWTGPGVDAGFDGFMAGHRGSTSTGTWYFDWIAGRADGDFTPAQWDPVDPEIPQDPYLGTPAAIPGTVEAENYDEGGEGVAYHDTTSTNDGGQYRTDGVDIETCSDTGSGYDVSSITTGEWLEYEVNVATAGYYDIAMRVATPNSGCSFHIEINGSNLTGTKSITSTGDYQTWATVAVLGIYLNAGQQILRVAADTGGWNFNNVAFTASTNNAQYISDTIPATMTAGQQYSVSVTMKNTGTAVWTSTGQYKLGAIGDSDPFASTRQNLSGSDSIANNQQKTFTFTMTAPTTPNTYTTDWRMVQDGVEWFGDTLTKQVQVNADQSTIISNSAFNSGVDGWTISLWHSGSYSDGTMAWNSTAGNPDGGVRTIGYGASDNTDRCTREGGMLSKTISTVGYSNIRVSYDLRVNTLGGNYTGAGGGSCAVDHNLIDDQLTVYYTINGKNWVELEYITRSTLLSSYQTYGTRTINLSSITGVNNNSKFGLRFRWQINGTNDTVDLDNIKVTSTP